MPGLSTYFCVICGQCQVTVHPGGARVIVHKDIPHPEDMTYDEEDNPQ
jgi:hypothetical protein